MKPPPKRPILVWEHDHARVPLPVYLLMAAVVVAIVVHGLITAQPRKCVAWGERPSPVVEARR